jgi:hypothetical protein
LCHSRYKSKIETESKLEIERFKAELDKTHSQFTVKEIGQARTSSPAFLSDRHVVNIEDYWKISTYISSDDCGQEANRHSDFLNTKVSALLTHVSLMVVTSTWFFTYGKSSGIAQSTPRMIVWTFYIMQLSQ